LLLAVGASAQPAALRRLFAALLQAEGVPLQEIGDLMGHSEIRVTEGYAYTMPDRLHKAMSSVDRVLSDDAGPEPVKADDAVGT